jgi:hypothetical protein
LPLRFDRASCRVRAVDARCHVRRKRMRRADRRLAAERSRARRFPSLGRGLIRPSVRTGSSTRPMDRRAADSMRARCCGDQNTCGQCVLRPSRQGARHRRVITTRVAKRGLRAPMVLQDSSAMAVRCRAHRRNGHSGRFRFGAPFSARGTTDGDAKSGVNAMDLTCRYKPNRHMIEGWCRDLCMTFDCETAPCPSTGAAHHSFHRGEAIGQVDTSVRPLLASRRVASTLWGAR